MRLLTLIAAGLMATLAYAAAPPAASPSAVGMWEQTYSDGRVGGWFLIFENNGEYQGAIAKMFLKPGEDPHPICTHCTGDQKNQPSLGLVIIKGMQRNGLVYEKGNILDPRDGQVYHAKMTLSADGQQLTVRGYLGFELLGQNQVWKRLPNDALPQDQVPPNLLPYWLALQSSGSGKTGGAFGRTGSINAYRPLR